MKGDGEDSPAKAGQDPYSQGGHKEQKVLSLSYTVIDPGTVVVEALRETSV